LIVTQALDLKSAVINAQVPMKVDLSSKNQPHIHFVSQSPL